MKRTLLKVAAVVWIMLGTVLAGVAMTVIITKPPLADQAMKLIPIYCGAAFAVALPLSWIVARRIAGTGAA